MKNVSFKLVLVASIFLSSCKNNLLDRSSPSATSPITANSSGATSSAAYTGPSLVGNYKSGCLDNNTKIIVDTPTTANKVEGYYIENLSILSNNTMLLTLTEYSAPDCSGSGYLAEKKTYSATAITTEERTKNPKFLKLHPKTQVYNEINQTYFITPLTADSIVYLKSSTQNKCLDSGTEWVIGKSVDCSLKYIGHNVKETFFYELSGNNLRIAQKISATDGSLLMPEILKRD